jgi:hypothetical protein
MLKLIKNKISAFLLVAIAMLMLALFLGGCLTPQERRGYSSIPQNSPSTWENRPYGDIGS